MSKAGINYLLEKIKQGGETQKVSKDLDEILKYKKIFQEHRVAYGEDKVFYRKLTKQAIVEELYPGCCVHEITSLRTVMRDSDGKALHASVTVGFWRNEDSAQPAYTSTVGAAYDEIMVDAFCDNDFRKKKLLQTVIGQAESKVYGKVLSFELEDEEDDIDPDMLEATDEANDQAKFNSPAQSSSQPQKSQAKQSSAKTKAADTDETTTVVETDSEQPQTADTAGVVTSTGLPVPQKTSQKVLAKAVAKAQKVEQPESEATAESDTAQSAVNDSEVVEEAEPKPEEEEKDNEPKELVDIEEMSMEDACKQIADIGDNFVGKSLGEIVSNPATARGIAWLWNHRSAVPNRPEEVTEALKVIITNTPQLQKFVQGWS